jgi:predicted nucleotidyltransferase
MAAVGGYDPSMRRADVIARISARREELTKLFGVRSLALFGSVARDEARPDSDVDVLVEFEGPTTFDAHMGLLVFLEDLLGCRVDVVTAKGIKPRLRPLIDQDLVRVA